MKSKRYPTNFVEYTPFYRCKAKICFVCTFRMPFPTIYAATAKTDQKRRTEIFRTPQSVSPL